MTNVGASMTLAVKNLQKTYAGFEVTPNANGQIYYELKLGSSGFMSLINLKAAVKEYNLLS